MERDRGPFSDAEPQENEIDPRLQEAVSGSQSLTTPSLSDHPGQFRLPPPPPPPFQHLQPHQQHPHPHQQQHPYGGPPPQWPQDGFSSYYGPPDQHSLPIAQTPQQSGQAYQPFHNLSGTPMQQQLQTPLSDSTDIKRPRACEACRNLKVRCEPDPAGGTCKRCAKANRTCVITAPSRKRQKKTDSRVAELERKIDALTQNLESTREGNVSASDDGIDGEGDNTHLGPMRDRPLGPPTHDSNRLASGQKRGFSEHQQDTYAGYYGSNFPARADQAPPPNAPYLVPEAQMGPLPRSRNPKIEELLGAGQIRLGEIDDVSRRVLRKSTADDLFYHYAKKMALHMPIVVFSKDTNSEAIRKSSPILFLAILSVASSQKYSDLQSMLKEEIMRVLADSMVSGNNKSLELIQAYQVITIWYLPEPDKESKYFQFVHIATGIAIDLGINKKSDAKRNKFSILQRNSSTIDTESIECRRAWLGCYLLYSSIAMGTRRTNLISNDAYLQNCMTVLGLSEDALESEGDLVKLVFLQTLADDLSDQILPNQRAPITEAKARSAHKDFQREMKAWEGDSNGKTRSLSLTLTFNVINLYMHELVMQHVASLEPGKPPQRARGKNQSQPSASARTGSSDTAMASALGILETFLRFTVQEMRTLPTFFFAQIAHASLSLIKMYFVGQADATISKEAPVSAEMVEDHLTRLSDSLRLASSESLIASTSLKMIVTLHTVFVEHKDSPLASIKARYGGVPSLKGAQLLDLEEPKATPQQRTAARGNAETADEALHLLSAVAMGKSNANEYQTEGVHSTGSNASGSVDGETAAMGQLIGEGDLGFMSDEGFIGIMQQMWARST